MYTNAKMDELRQQAEQLIQDRIAIPEGYEYRSSLLLNHDEIPVFVYRYEKQNGQNAGYGGEHFSVSVDLNVTRIMGFMHVDSQHCGPGLPDEESAKETAVEALKVLAPDVGDAFEIKWVLSLKEKPEKIPHELPFPYTDDQGNEHLATGMRVKLFFTETQSWGWVIVGRGGALVAFEREVTWNTIMNRRSTPAWLHDPFVMEVYNDLKNNMNQH